MVPLPLDSLIFLLVLAAGSAIVYYSLRAIWKVVYWGFAVGIAYAVFKIFLLTRVF